VARTILIDHYPASSGTRDGSDEKTAHGAGGKGRHGVRSVPDHAVAGREASEILRRPSEALADLREAVIRRDLQEME